MKEDNNYVSIYHDTDAVLAAMQHEERKAMRRRKLLGNSIAEMDEHANVVIVQPEDIVGPRPGIVALSRLRLSLDESGV